MNKDLIVSVIEYEGSLIDDFFKTTKRRRKESVSFYCCIKNLADLEIMIRMLLSVLERYCQSGSDQATPRTGDGLRSTGRQKVLRSAIEHYFLLIEGFMMTIHQRRIFWTQRDSPYSLIKNLEDLEIIWNLRLSHLDIYNQSGSDDLSDATTLGILGECYTALVGVERGKKNKKRGSARKAEEPR